MTQRDRDLEDFTYTDDWMVRLAREAMASSGRDLTASAAQAVLDETIEHTLPGAAQRLFRAFKREGRRSMRAESRDRRGFERRLQNTWGEALDRSWLLLALCRDAGSGVNERHRPELAPKQDHKFEALTRLHGRACAITYEILKCLDAGLASAALARWRTLHEVTVVAQFIADHSQDTARRYLLHDRATLHASALEYQRYSRRIGAEPVSAERLATLLQARDQLRAEFGRCYHRENGWAFEAMGRKCSPEHEGSRGCRVTIAELEQSVDLDHWRPYYRMASHGTHAGPRALNWSLELKDNTELIRVGPSDGGLYEPLVLSAKSLLQTTATLVLYRPSYVMVATLDAIELLIDEIETEAIRANDLCERRAAATDRLWRWQDWLRRRRPR